MIRTFPPLCLMLFLISGCTPGSGTSLTTGPGSTVNSGKQQCKYKISAVSQWQTNCQNYVGQFICMEVCTGTTAPCVSAGNYSIDMAGFGAAMTCDNVTICLEGCELCNTAIPDGW